MQLIFTLGTSYAFHFRRQFSKKNAKIAILYPSVFLFERGERSSKIESVKFVKGMKEGGFGIKFPQTEQSTQKNIWFYNINSSVLATLPLFCKMISKMASLCFHIVIQGDH